MRILNPRPFYNLYRYRRVHSTHGLEASLRKMNHLPKLGTLLHIEGVRYRCTQGKLGERWTTTVERVRVRGKVGRANLGGFCWGFGGQGPRGLYQFLVTVGVPTELAGLVAFNTQRKEYNDLGTDWRLERSAEGVWTRTIGETYKDWGS